MSSPGDEPHVLHVSSGDGERGERLLSHLRRHEATRPTDPPEPLGESSAGGGELVWNYHEIVGPIVTICDHSVIKLSIELHYNLYEHDVILTQQKVCLPDSRYESTTICWTVLKFTYKCPCVLTFGVKYDVPVVPLLCANLH